MKLPRFLTHLGLPALFLFPLNALAVDPPAILNHQGRIAVDEVNLGTPTPVTGYFKFALVNGDASQAYWTNSPDISPADGEPDTAVGLTVDNGHYAVGIGDTGVTGMAAVPVAVFSDHDDVHLRIWFSSDNSTFNLLSPDRRITSAGYALNAATAQSIPDNSVTSSMLQDGAVTAGKLEAGAVSSVILADGAVTSAKLEVGAVSSSMLADGAVTTNKIGPAAVTTSKLGNGAVTPPILADSAVTTAKLSDGAVTSEKIGPAAVTGAKMGAGAVSTPILADGSVTTAKLANGAVSDAQIANGAVTAGKLGTHAVGTGNIANGAVTADKIAPGVIASGSGASSPVVVQGTARAASANTTLVATSGSLTKFYLPPGSMNGDLIDIVGSGTGGWEAYEVGWSPLPLTHVAVVASSSNGLNLVAYQSGLGVKWSQSGGAAWAAPETGISGQVVDMASAAASGSFAAVVYGGPVWTSVDGGENWVARTSAGSRNWVAIASSHDGMKLVAAEEFGSLFTSPDGGVTWTERASDKDRTWKKVASSDDGVNLIACADSGAGDSSSLYLSGDSGATWNPIDPTNGAGLPPYVPSPDQVPWLSVTSSANGMRLAASAGGFIFTSDDGGTSWTQRLTGSYDKLACSADGLTLVAWDSVVDVGDEPDVTISHDGGETWTAQIIPPLNPTSQDLGFALILNATVSRDGGKIFVAPGYNSLLADNRTLVASGSGPSSTAATASFGADGKWHVAGETTIADEAVTNSGLASDSVTTTKILNAAVTSAKIANDAVTSAQIADGSVTASDLAGDIGLWSLNGGNVYRSAGKVSIGTSMPASGTDLTVQAGPGGVPGGISLLQGDGTEAGVLGIPATGGHFSSSAIAGDLVIRSSTGKVHLQSGTASAALTVSDNHNVGVGMTTPDERLTVNGNVKCTTIIITSDRDQKAGFEPVDTRAVLDKVAGMPISRWHYTSDEKSIPHVGPMAQDFHAAFGVGPDERHITTVDADGVALAAIQALKEMVDEKDAKIEALEKRLEALEKHLSNPNGDQP